MSRLCDCGAVAAGPSSGHSDVAEENRRIVLTPKRPSRADAVRTKLADLGLSKTDVAESIA